MYEQEIAFINQRIEELTKKVKLKKKPKLKKSMSIILASSNGLLNSLYVSEHLLAQWHEGVLDERDVNATLAHEFGHFIDYQKSRLRNLKHGLALPSYMILLLAALVFYWSLRVAEPGAITALIVLLWTFFLPSVMRRVFISGELEADRLAIAFSLIESQQLADAIVKRIGLKPAGKLGPTKLMELVENMLTHPFLYERLHNIGFEIKRPAETRRITSLDNRTP
jgi:hypothetical protein